MWAPKDAVSDFKQVTYDLETVPLVWTAIAPHPARLGNSATSFPERALFAVLLQALAQILATTRAVNRCMVRPLLLGSRQTPCLPGLSDIS